MPCTNKTKESLLRWENKLLDLSKKNNLINYKDSKSGTLKLIVPELSIAFKKILSGISIEIFDDKNEDFNLDDDEKNIDPFANEELFLEKYKRNIKPSHLVFFNKNNFTKTILKNLKRKATEALNERGVNILFIAIGFLNWKNADSSNECYKAPILLVPVELLHDAINKPYRIKNIDDAQININLQYMLKEEFGIDLPFYEDGEDITEYFKKINDEISGLGFSIVEEVRLSTFSFNKLGMYLDLKNNEKKVCCNPNVKAIAGDAVEDEIFLSSEEKNKINNTRDLFLSQHNVVDADFSQTEAIQYALSGKSFVLQGPPGTGKSQTITNIIAELINNGKKVLFVSEKLAALEVVYNNLKKVGLDCFCLRLHSNKANKKEFVSDLCSTLNMQRLSLNHDADAKLHAVETRVNNLNKYDANLFKIHRPINMSLHDMIVEVVQLSFLKDFVFPLGNVENRSKEDLDKTIKILNEYESIIKKLKFKICNHPFRGLNFDDFRKKYEFYKVVNDINHFLRDFLNTSIEMGKVYNFEIHSIQDYKRILDFVNYCVSIKIHKNSLLSLEKLSVLINKIPSVWKHSFEIKRIDDEIFEYFDKSILDIEINSILNSFKSVNGSLIKRIFDKDYRCAKKELKKYIHLPKSNFKNTLQKLQKIKERELKLFDFNYEVMYFSDLFDEDLINYKTDWGLLEKNLKYLYDFLDKNQLFIKFNIENYNLDNHKKYESAYKEIVKYYTEFEKYLYSYEKEYEDLSVIDLIERTDKLLNNFELFDEWLEFSIVRKLIYENSLNDFITDCSKHEVDIDMFALTYKKLFYKQWIEYILHSDREFYKYQRFYHELDISNFKNDDIDSLNVSKAIIKCNITSAFPDTSINVNDSPASILKRENAKSRKLKTIRTLMSEIPDFIQVLKPCFLMSPLSISTFLSKDTKFDTVIFDEASQVFPEDAIVAIYRAKQIIVVGDSKQMPPTKFFISGDHNDEEYDEESSDIDAYESILDLCSTVFPQKSLLCHYRSRNESLISFSNKYFYKGELITYPSVAEKRKNYGVDYTFVPDGTFSSKKYNLKEAEKVVDVVFEHFKNNPDRSLGVIAFNTKQEDVILKLLDKKRAENPSFEEFFSTDKVEPFFVKNLETVQGDERDTIIFSTTYGKNEAGTFAMRFGPLGNKGGERRLNVAITRAKFNVKVISSMKAFDIDISRITNEGPKLLRDYLNYAENGTEAIFTDLEVSSELQFDSPFEKQVYEFLKDKGFDVNTQIGSSKYRIDLGLKKPGTSEYVLAIECDGASYHSSKSARDRDRLRQCVLERMGWKFYRIWSTDWYKNPIEERKLLIEACNKALDNSSIDDGNNTNSSTPKDFVNVIEKTEDADILDEYIFTEQSPQLKWQKEAELIINNEGPIHVKNLVRRLCGKLGYEVCCPSAIDAFNYRFNSAQIKRKKGFYYIEEQEQYYMRKYLIKYCKEVEEISPIELRNGMYSLIENQKWCSKESVYDFIKKSIGFSRNGEKILKHLDEAFSLLTPYVSIDHNNKITININKKLILKHRSLNYESVKNN